LEQEYDVTNDALLNSITSEVGKWLEMPKVKVLNIHRLASFRNALKKLLGAFDQEWLISNVSVTECPLETGDISVSFETSGFIVRDTKGFSEAIKEFENYELYPTTNGNIIFAAIFPQVMSVFPLT